MQAVAGHVVVVVALGMHLQYTLLAAFQARVIEQVDDLRPIGLRETTGPELELFHGLR